MATINESKIVRTYRVNGNDGRLIVTADQKIWYTQSPATDGAGYSHIANVGDRCSEKKLTKDNVCRAANCY